MTSNACHGTEKEKGAYRLHDFVSNLGQEDTLAVFLLAVPLWDSNTDKAVRKEGAVMER